MPWCSDKTRVVTVAMLLGSFLAGCSDLYYDRRDPVSFAADNAVATAQATQTIDPWPPASSNRSIASHGPRVAGAIERYRTGQIIQPKGTGTSSAGYSSQSPSGQGGGGQSNTSATSWVK